MKNLIIVLLIAVINVHFVFAQQKKIDSLKLELKKAIQDTTKARLLSEIGIAAYYVNSDLAKKHNDTLINFSKGVSEKHLAQGYKMRGVFFLLASDYNNASIWYIKALELAKKNKDKNGQADFLSGLGDLNGRQGNTDIAVDYYLQSINLYKEIDMEVKSVNAYSNLATVLSSNNEIIKANEYLIEALAIAEKHNSDKLYLVQKSIGANYIKLLQYEKAEFYLLKALDLAKKAEDIFTVGSINQSLSVMYDGSLNDYKKALYHAEQSLHYFKLVNNINGIINSYNGIGQQNFQLENKVKAKTNYLKGLALATKTKDTNTLIITNYHLAELFASQGNTTQANKYITDGDNLGGNQYKMYFKNHFWKIGNAFAKSKNYKQAFDNVKSFAVLSDSLYKKNGVDKVIELETKYQTEKKEKELVISRQEIIQKDLEIKTKERTILFFSSIVLIGIILALFFLYIKEKKKLAFKKQVEAFKYGFDKYLIHKYGLKDDELQLWLKIAEGFSEKEIAEIFFKSIDTIKNWRKSLYSKIKPEKNILFKQKHAIELYNKEKNLFQINQNKKK